MSSTGFPNRSAVQLHVIIVGAGIAGLSAAVALKKNGHKVDVFERSKFADEVGAAITLSPNGTRVLKKLDFNFKEAGGVDITDAENYDGITLEPTNIIHLGDGEKVHGAPHQAFHRVDLHSQLAKLAVAEHPGEATVTIHLGSKITHVDVDNARIELGDGSTFTGDLLIGADGIHSIVRAAALKSTQPPIDSGWTIYRFLIPRERVMGDPELRAMKKEHTRLVFTNGQPLKYVVVWYQCRNGDVQNLAAFYRGDEHADGYVEDFDHSADKAKVLELFSHFHPNVLTLINKADKILCWRILDREPVNTFVYGKTLLVGDAGHPMSPFTAQGGVQAIEDAGAILGLLSNLPSKEFLPERLRMYDRVRLIRAIRFQVGGVVAANEHHPLVSLKEKYDALDERPKGLGLKEAWDWDFRYDVFEKCESILRE